jgi:hypothetical protein
MIRSVVPCRKHGGGGGKTQRMDAVREKVNYACLLAGGGGRVLAGPLIPYLGFHENGSRA